MRPMCTLYCWYLEHSVPWPSTFLLLPSSYDVQFLIRHLYTFDCFSGWTDTIIPSRMAEAFNSFTQTNNPSQSGASDFEMALRNSHQHDSDPFANFSYHPPKPSGPFRQFGRRSKYRAMANLSQSRDKLAGSNTSLAGSLSGWYDVGGPKTCNNYDKRLWGNLSTIGLISCLHQWNLGHLSLRFLGLTVVNQLQKELQ